MALPTRATDGLDGGAEFVTIPRAAKVLGIGPKLLRKACAAGEINVYNVGWPRVRLVDVRLWIESQRVPATPHAKAVVDAILRREARCDR